MKSQNDSIVALPWGNEVLNPVRNTNQTYLKFVNTLVFSEDGRRFLRYGYYTDAPKGTLDYDKYWEEQERRCLNGYTVGGVRITGRQYFFLNFCPMKARPIDPVTGLESIKSQKKWTLPRFLDHSYYFFHELEECLAEGPHVGKEKQGMCVLKSRRKGFEQPNSEIVMTPYGETTMGEIKKGDLVVGSDGKPTIVLNTFPQGAKDVYEIEFFDGRKVRCGENHLWEVFTSRGRKSILTTRELVDKGLTLQYSNFKVYKYKVRISKPVEYEEKSLPIPPYALGAFIGDGNITKQLKLSGIDKEVLDRVLEELNSTTEEGECYYLSSEYKANWQISFSTYRDGYWRDVYNNKYASHINPVYGELKKLKLNVKADKKHIPTIYKYGSIRQRKDLIKGLMDTDGSVTSKGFVSFSSVSEQLVDDVQYVLYSLGISSTKRHRNDGMFILYIATAENLFGITRKQERIKQDKKHRIHIPIVNITKLDYKEESTCISVDAKDSLYLTKGYIPTHNTYQISDGVFAYNFQFVPHSMNMLAAFEKAHYKVTLDGIHSSLNHINKSTPWIRRREVLNQRDHFRASFKEKNAQNVEIEDGYLSEIHAVSFKDNPFKSIGESVDIVGFEEAGKFTGLLEALAITEPTYRDGDIMTGVPLVWGTGGSVDEGGTALESFFYNPKAYGFKAYNNIYDDNATGDCGWFVDDLWYLPGKTLIDGKEQDMLDSQGNSIRSIAYEGLMRKRDEKKKGDPRAYKTFITQQPLTPKEALMRTDGDFFDVISAQDRLSQIETNPGIYLNTIFIGKLHINDSNKIDWRPSEDTPVREFPMRDNKNKPGAIEIFEHPVRNERGEIPASLYIAGIDPYDDDESTTDSLGSTLIMNIATDRIVAEYTGRPATAYQYYENVRRLLMYYNALAMYENAKKGLFAYFERMNSTYLLADTPKFLKDMELVKGGGTGNSSKGYYPSQQVNAFGRGLIRNWSQQLAHGHDDGVTNMLVIRSWGLLKELANYNSKGNFDRVSAAIALMLLREEKARYLTPGLMEQKQNLKREDKFFSRNYGNKNPYGGILFGNRR